MSAPSLRTVVAHVARSIEISPVPTALVKDGDIIHENPAFQQLCGNPMAGHSIYSLFTTGDANQLHWLLNADHHHWEMEKTVFVISVGESAGKEVMVQYWPIGEKLSLFSLLSDFSSERLADIDALTGLPNRRKANMLLDIEKNRGNRYSQFCLAMGDIDHFKNINDNYGHDIGDKVLRHVANMISAVMRQGDWAARWGGEEFVVFVSNSDIVTGLQPIERIRQHINLSPLPEEPHITVSMSFGLASSKIGENIPALLNKADLLLYDAKNQGRNRTVWEQVGGKVWVAENIREAIRTKKITPIYLPVRNWDNRPIAVVIQHGSQSEKSAKNLLSAAERLSLRKEVDKALVDQALEDLPQDSPIPMLFPVNDILLTDDNKPLLELFKRFPYLSAGLDHHPNPKAFDTIIREKIPVGLMDFFPDQAPIDFLCRGMVKHIVFAHPQRIHPSVLEYLSPNCKIYAGGGYPTSADEERETEAPGGQSELRKGLLELGFDGFVDSLGTRTLSKILPNLPQ